MIGAPIRWAGLTLDRPRIMGVLNVTPDSFSDGGAYPTPEHAVEAGMRMLAEGADIVDIGGESTRPGAPTVPPDAEQARVLPVVRWLVRQGAKVSVDTRNAATMIAALDAGALIVNDISGLTHDPEALGVAVSRHCPVVLMHTRGTPETMRDRAVYDDPVREVLAELRALADRAIAAGVDAGAIALDPGIGFAKTAEHSVAILRSLRLFAELGFPLLVGVSRKSFIGALAGEPDPMQRLPGSLAAALASVAAGASILRVHDVAATIQAVKVWTALTTPGQCNAGSLA